MTTTGVGGDRQHGPAFAGHQSRAGGEVERPLRAHGIGGTVAFLGVMRVVKQRVDGLVALEVEDAEDLAFFDFVNPRIAGVDDGIDHGLAGIEGALDEVEGAHGWPQR